MNPVLQLILMINSSHQNNESRVKSKIRDQHGSVLVENLLSHSFLKDMERLAKIAGGPVAEPLSRDFKKKYQRRFTQKESPELPLSKIYEMYGCGYLNKGQPKNK